MSAAEKEQLLQRVELALDEIRPHLKVDKGDIELVDITDDLEVKVKWLGSCEYCSMSAMTMKAGVEHTIKQKLPEIKSVQAVNGVA